MFMLPLLIVVSPIEHPSVFETVTLTELAYTKKKKSQSSGGAGRKFKSCAAARRAGYTHMRRGHKGYSNNLDRDGDGIACDKVK